MLSVNCLYQMNEKKRKGVFEKMRGVYGNGSPPTPAKSSQRDELDWLERFLKLSTAQRYLLLGCDRQTQRPPPGSS